MLGVLFFREEKKKKQKQEGLDAEEKNEVLSVGDQGAKSGGGLTQQPLKRGQKVREDSLEFLIVLPCFTYDVKEWSQ